MTGTAWIAFRSDSAALLMLTVALVAPWIFKLELSGLEVPAIRL